MRVKKMFQGKVPENKILSTYSDSPTDTYSCDYVNQLIEPEDLTSQLSFVNCTLQSGKVIKFGKVVFMQIKIIPTITSDWSVIVQNLPSSLWPLVTHDGGTPISGASFWVYGEGKGTINGGTEAGTAKNISGFYIAQN